MTLRLVPARFSLLLSCVLLLQGGAALAQNESFDQSNSDLHITAYDDPGKHLAVRNLLQWSLTDGQSYAEALHYILLPAAVISADVSNLDHS